MIRILTALCLFVFCSCAAPRKQMVNLPHSEHSWQIKIASEAPKADRVSQAIIIFYQRWVFAFGDKKGKIKKNLDKIMIEWSSKEKILYNLGTDIKGNKMKQGVVKGMALSPTYIWLKTNEYKRVFASSLVHELVHVALWADGCQGGDPDHEGNKYQCWTKRHTNFARHLNKLLFRFDI